MHFPSSTVSLTLKHKGVRLISHNNSNNNNVDISKNTYMRGVQIDSTICEIIVLLLLFGVVNQAVYLMYTQYIATYKEGIER